MLHESFKTDRRVSTEKAELLLLLLLLLQDSVNPRGIINHSIYPTQQ